MAIIEVTNLGKKYNIGERQNYLALRDTLTYIIKSPLKWFGGKVKSLQSRPDNEFWALRDVNFTVKKGEVLGIIGRNGAGKSTLLKILSQITPPTTGEIRLGGRVGSLLEVGTGFHPELTGRENIFLNGAILGMRKKEIEKKFDEIVEFSGVEKFIDTPVKRYSSGMYVRLAFSVAAHLEPDILIIDEVLAVGDSEFQKKCLGKMEEVTKKEGRTVLFVSHNLAAVKKLCDRCVVLNNGSKVFEGGTEKALLAYDNLQSSRELKMNKGEYNNNRRGSGTLSFTEIEMFDTNDKKRNMFNIGETVRFKMSYAVLNEMEGLYVLISLYKDRLNGVLTTVKHELRNNVIKKGENGSAIVDVELSHICPGEYSLHFWLGDKMALHQGTPLNYDVVDNVVGPLVIKASSEEEKEMAGYFTLPSNMNILK
ncbi:MAG: ABC transporter ATP-binding protein [Patescibacteria group bacterium]|nr:ABC transporter ATP-binding protein [Patescibacteria group bacterium]